MKSDPLSFLGTELESLKQQGLYRKLRVLEGKPESHTTYDHKSVVNLSSNNYLGQTTHPKLKQAALDILETEPQWIEKLWDNTRFFKAGLDSLGFNTGMSESPITPVIVGEAATAAKMSDTLFDRGVFAQSIGFPTVARDKARLRTIVSATHTKEDLQYALDTLGTVGRELGVI